jgi:alginate O-acetyltransferase complex protein AlgI
MADYWRRWHMSLNFWMRDYVFRPLVYSKALWFLGRYRLYAAILFSMLFIGIWHGFTWNFIVWGLYMGALICLELVFEPWLERIPKIFRIGLTFWLLLNSYVIFMNQNIQQVKVYFSKMYSDVSVQSVDVPFAIVIAILIVGPHIVDAVLLRFEYFRKETALAIVASLAFLLCHYWLDGFNGAPFEYFKF